MLTREEQKALFNTLTSNLTINTKVDGSGNNVTMPVQVFWNHEPKQINLTNSPIIIITFTVLNNPYQRTLGDLWRNTSQGEFIGYIVEDTLLVKIKTVDYINGSDFIEKTDIADALLDRVVKKALHEWDDLISEGSVEGGGISPATDVSQILENELYKEYQLTIRILKLIGGIPTETGLVKYSTAPTLLEVKHTEKFEDIPN